MVIKIIRSGSPGNLINYLLGGGHDGVEDRTRIISGNFMDLDGTKVEMASEFAAYAGGSKLKHPCFHCIVSLPPREVLTESQTHKLIQDIEKALKMEDYPFLAVQHTEKEHNHYHIAIGRQSPLHNKVLHDPYSFRVLTKLAREKERQWGLKQLPDPFKKEAFVRSDQRKATIRSKVIQSLSKADNYDDFVRELKLRGITVDKQRGISYSDGVIRVKGSDPGINYSLGKVQAIFNSKQDAPEVEAWRVPNDSYFNIKSEPIDRKEDVSIVASSGLEGLLSAIAQDVNGNVPVASPRPPSEEEDEEYWKRKRKKRRFY